MSEVPLYPCRSGGLGRPPRVPEAGPSHVPRRARLVPRRAHPPSQAPRRTRLVPRRAYPGSGTRSSVRRCWELQEPNGPKGREVTCSETRCERSLEVGRGAALLLGKDLETHHRLGVLGVEDSVLGLGVDESLPLARHHLVVDKAHLGRAALPLPLHVLLELRAPPLAKLDLLAALLLLRIRSHVVPRQGPLAHDLAVLLVTLHSLLPQNLLRHRRRLKLQLPHKLLNRL
mmetsp:Transcript_9465/g.22279  ORF Transcript_9465/g.22279 Transcript_9465/m.22279 type:complete len:230 (-) Transcript_9465:528-1217(-)